MKDKRPYFNWNDALNVVAECCYCGKQIKSYIHVDVVYVMISETLTDWHSFHLHCFKKARKENYKLGKENDLS